MKFSTIKDLPDKAIVPEFMGRVVKVYEAYRPSAAQDRVGIHKQPIIVQNDEGDQLNVDILHKNLHLPFTAEGGVFVFKSMPKERTEELDGIQASRWTGDKGENFSVEIRTGAHFYQKDAATLPPVFNPTHRHETEFFVGIVGTFEEKFRGSDVWDAFMKDPHALTAAASSVYIECGRNGIKSRWMADRARELGITVPQTAAPTPPPQNETPAPAKEEVRSNPPPATASTAPEKRPIDKHVAGADMENPENTLALMIYGGMEAERIKRAIDDAFKGEAPAWERIMDFLFKMLQTDGVLLQHIHEAYDKAKGAIKKNADPSKRITNETVCKNIALKFPQFMELVKAAQAANNPAPASIGSDQDVLTPID